jgi:hypothetical protein
VREVQASLEGGRSRCEAFIVDEGLQSTKLRRDNTGSGR